jgi:hypothetical protein
VHGHLTEQQKGLPLSELLTDEQFRKALALAQVDN